MIGRSWPAAFRLPPSATRRWLKSRTRTPIRLSRKNGHGACGELTRRLNLEKEHPDSLKFATEETNLQNEPDIKPNQRPSSPNKPLNLIISFLLGIIVGVVFVILKEQFSNIFQSEKDVENTLKLPVIAMVPAADGGGEEIE